MRSASSRQMPRSLRIHSTANPNSNSPRAIVRARLSICQLWAAPLPMHVDDLLDVEPGALGEVHALRQTLHDAGDADLVDHLRELPGAGRAQTLARLGVRHRSRRGPTSKTASSSLPHITVSAPFSAPACPPDTGASTNPTPRRRRPPPARGRARPMRSCGRRASNRPAIAGERAVVADTTSIGRRRRCRRTHHELGALGGLGRCRRRPMPVLGDPGQRLARRAVVDGDVVAGLGEVTGHRTHP